VLQCFLDCPSKNHCPNGTTAPCDFASAGTSNKGQGIEVVNIMEALKESMQAKGRAKVGDAVRRRMGPRKRRQHREPQDQHQARAGRRIEEQLDVALRRWK